MTQRVDHHDPRTWSTELLRGVVREGLAEVAEKARVARLGWMDNTETLNPKLDRNTDMPEPIRVYVGEQVALLGRSRLINGSLLPPNKDIDQSKRKELLRALKLVVDETKIMDEIIAMNDKIAEFLAKHSTLGKP